MGKEGTKEKLDIELEAPADFTSPEVLYQDLVKTIHKYHPSDDISMIEKAYKVAAEAHKDQKRKSGEPYIIHPLCVAIILADLEMDKETIAAGLLHDVVEDTVMTLDELTKEFGPEVAFLVDGVTKLTQLNWDKDKVEIQAENLRKMFLAMAKGGLRNQIHGLRRNGTHEKLHGKVFTFGVKECRSDLPGSRRQPRRLHFDKDNAALLVGRDFQSLRVVNHIGDLLPLDAHEIDVIARERMCDRVCGLCAVCDESRSCHETGQNGL